jgi:hypothetical protein
MERIINALLEGIRGLGLEAVLAPQQASANRLRIELFIAGIEPAGIDSRDRKSGSFGWERITFNAVFKSEGTHAKWVEDIILALRKLLPLNETPLRLTITTDDGLIIARKYNLEAVWKRLAAGRFEYPDEEESSMPVRYAENWEVSIAYPAHIVGLGPEEEL